MRGNAAFSSRARAFVADGAPMGEVFLGGEPLFRPPRSFHRGAPLLGNQLLVAGEKFFHLDRVVRERLGRRVDRRESAADDHDRQAQLHVGERVALGRAGKLQRHQEVGRGAYAIDQSVRQLEHGRPARAGRERDMVEAELERAFRVERAAETHAAEQRVTIAPFEQDADELQEILVPAHRDAVFGDTAKACHHAIVERLVQRCDIADRRERDALAVLGDAGDVRGQAARSSSHRCPRRV